MPGRITTTMAENDAAAAEAEASKKAAEKELTFSLPGLFSKADPERMRMAIAAARTAGVDEAAVVEAEGKMVRVLEREEEERKRLIRVQEAEEAEAAAKQVADYLGTVHHAYTFTVEQGVDAVSQVIQHLETFDVTTIRAATCVTVYLPAN